LLLFSPVPGLLPGKSGLEMCRGFEIVEPASLPVQNFYTILPI